MAEVGRPAGVANPYSLMGLQPGASLADVRRAYRRLAIHFHPDHAGPGSLKTFLAVKAAYEWIVAHPSLAVPGDRPPRPVPRATVARTIRRTPPVPVRPVPEPAAQSSWPGGRWYWERAAPPVRPLPGAMQDRSRLLPESGQERDRIVRKSLWRDR
jgi:hypothetical protein